MGERERIALVCEVCKSRNYATTKHQTTANPSRLAKKKHCPTCNKHTEHKESK